MKHCLLTRSMFTAAVALAAISSTAHGHNSIIPAEGWKVGPAKKLAPADKTQLIKAQSDHFEILTTLPQEAADQMVRHLEVWHSQLFKVLPHCEEIEKSHNGKWPRVGMKVFAYPEEKGDFYNRGPMSGNTTGGVVCRANRNKEGYRTVQITAMQHEVFHFWDGVYYGKGISISMSEGGANFFGYWDIDKSEQDNLYDKMRDLPWQIVYDTKLGKTNKTSRFHWMNTWEFFSNDYPGGSQVYHQGMLFYRFLLADKRGRWHGEIVFHAYQTHPAAQEWMNSSPENIHIKDEFRSVKRALKRIAGKGKVQEVPFTDDYLRMFDKDWKQYLAREYMRLYPRKNQMSLGKPDSHPEDASARRTGALTAISG